MCRLEVKLSSPVQAGDGAQVLKVWDVAGNWREVPLSVRDDPDEGKAWVPPGPTDVSRLQPVDLSRRFVELLVAHVRAVARHQSGNDVPDVDWDAIAEAGEGTPPPERIGSMVTAALVEMRGLTSGPMALPDGADLMADASVLERIPPGQRPERRKVGPIIEPAPPAQAPTAEPPRSPPPAAGQPG